MMMRRTATSRTSFWLLLVHWRAFRIGGSLAVSNFTGKQVSEVCTKRRGTLGAGGAARRRCD